VTGSGGAEHRQGLSRGQPQKPCFAPAFNGLLRASFRQPSGGAPETDAARHIVPFRSVPEFVTGHSVLPALEAPTQIKSHIKAQIKRPAFP